MPQVNKVVFFWLQYFIKKYLIDDFNSNFFNKDKETVIKQYSRRINNYLGKNSIWTKHIEDLYDLWFLPIEIKALKEWSIVNTKVPMITIKNTHPDFFWLTNYIETMLSATIWSMSTSATIAYEYRKLLDWYANATSDNWWFVDFQWHDFSMRWMSSIESGAISGSGHLLSFKWTDTLPAIDILEDYYNADSDKEMIWVSVAATEHSVMCMGWKEDEISTYKRIINDLYPNGIVSIVSDTYNLWTVIEQYLPQLKDIILQREWKVVIRPDSWNPIHILAWYTDEEAMELNITGIEKKWLIEALWDIFGWTINTKWYKELDWHIGAIYGDSITLDRAEKILQRLKDKWFSSTNVVFGIGSYTYQYNTRDTFMFAMKSTYWIVNWEERNIYKDPFTDKWMKKSAKWLLRVEKEGDGFVLYDEQSIENGNAWLLKTVFIDWAIKIDYSLQEIRDTIINKS